MNPLERLTSAFEHFPGIGPRQARRFVQYLLSAPAGARIELAESIKRLGTEVSQCKKCLRWSTKSESRAGLCSICSNTHRDDSLLFVVEKDADIEQVERSGFRGLYFVLGGSVPLAAEEPERHIRLRELLARIEGDASQTKKYEVILGLSATTEGDHTRLILQEKLRPVADGLGFKISSLGRGLSTGSELEYADPDTIQSALNSRN
jgi:recombination protein RecR